MGTWGGLNPALTSFRDGIRKRFPHKDTTSDGARADAVHGSQSQHQRDADSTVDAYDCDVNWLDSSDPDGNALEDRISEAVKADFLDDSRAQLWIHNREIANADIRDGAERPYNGPSPHTQHIHFESRQSRERDGRPWAMPRTDALIGYDEMTQDQLLDALESPRGQAALRNALTETAYGSPSARESIAGRIGNIDSKIDPISEGVQKLVASLPVPTTKPEVNPA
jgi:hypothetical protein